MGGLAGVVFDITLSRGGRRLQAELRRTSGPLPPLWEFFLIEIW